MKISLSRILLVLILILGFFLRTHKLDSVPSGFFADEASIGYNAYQLLNTGKDEYDTSFPVFFRSFGDYRPPLGAYSAIPFVAIGGLNESSIRLPSALYGLIAIITMYFIGKEISSNKSRSFGLITALVTATMPWLIHYNRTGFEFTIYVSLFIVTIFLLLKVASDKFFIIPAFIVASLTLYTYQPARLLLPLLLLGSLFVYRKIYLLHKSSTIGGLLLFFILAIPIILSFLNGQGFARFNMVSIFSAKLSIEQGILRSAQNYFIQLSPSYFITGEPTFITRHFVGGLTPLLITTLPFLLIGLIHTFFIVKKNKSAQLLMLWLIMYPIAGAVTADAPFTSRSVIGAPLFGILISLGIRTTVLCAKKFINSYILTPIIVFVILLNLALFTKFYFTQYPLYSSDFWGWQYGPKEIVRYFVSKEKEYDDLYMIPEFNAPYIFFKFYAPNDCLKCKIGVPSDSFNPNRKQLFAITDNYLKANPQFNFLTQKIIYYPNKTIAFKIGEIVQ